MASAVPENALPRTGFSRRGMVFFVQGHRMNPQRAARLPLIFVKFKSSNPASFAAPRLPGIILRWRILELELSGHWAPDGMPPIPICTFSYGRPRILNPFFATSTQQIRTKYAVHVRHTRANKSRKLLFISRLWANLHDTPGFGHCLRISCVPERMLSSYSGPGENPRSAQRARSWH